MASIAGAHTIGTENAIKMALLGPLTPGRGVTVGRPTVIRLDPSAMAFWPRSPPFFFSAAEFPATGNPALRGRDSRMPFF